MEMKNRVAQVWCMSGVSMNLSVYFDDFHGVKRDWIFVFSIYSGICKIYLQFVLYSNYTMYD